MGYFCGLSFFFFLAKKGPFLLLPFFLAGAVFKWGRGF